MILTIVAIAQAALAPQAGLTIVQVPEAGENVSIQALVRLPKLNDAERLCATVSWNTLEEGSEEYSKHTIRNYAHQTGRPMQIRSLSDHLFLRVTFPKAQLSTAMGMVESLLRRPLLTNEAIEHALREIQSPPRADLWETALLPEVWREAKPTREEIVGTFRRLVRPENITLAIGGAYDEAKLAVELKRFEGWAPRPERAAVRSWSSAASALLKSPNAVGSLELTGPEIALGDAAFPLHLLVAAGLGVGQGSALHRVSRESKGWSYRQEGFLQPTASGFRLRLLLAHAGEPPLLEIIEPLRAGLLQEVDAWTQADRGRAIAMLKSWLEDARGAATIRLDPGQGVADSLEERLHFAAWWRMKFGEALQSDSLIAKMEKVSLDDFKAAAAKAVEAASVRMLVPSGG